MAEAWATCSAVYEIYSDLLYDPGSASSELLKNLSRGAEVAVATSYVLQLIKERGDMNLELFISRFESTWSMARLQMQELPKSQMTTIMASGESNNYSDDWLTKLQATFQGCQDNNEDNREWLIFIVLW